MIFLDASAMVSVISAEAGSAAFADVMSSDEDFVSSPVAVWETVVAIRRKSRDIARPISVTEAKTVVDAVLAPINVEIQAIVAGDAEQALQAFARYSRGMGSKANLNMADCFHYAVAKRLGAQILFTSPGEFHHTDLLAALPQP